MVQIKRMLGKIVAGVALTLCGACSVPQGQDVAESASLPVGSCQFMSELTAAPGRQTFVIQLTGEAFTDAEMDGLLAGAGLWTRAAGIGFQFVITDQPKLGQLRVGHHALKGKVVGLAYPDRHIVLDTAKLGGNSAYVAAAFAHELGHEFGLDHATDDTDIMYPSVQPCGKVSDASLAKLERDFEARTHDGIYHPGLTELPPVAFSTVE